MNTAHTPPPARRQLTCGVEVGRAQLGCEAGHLRARVGNRLCCRRLDGCLDGGHRRLLLRGVGRELQAGCRQPLQQLLSLVPEGFGHHCGFRGGVDCQGGLADAAGRPLHQQAAARRAQAAAAVVSGCHALRGV